MIIYCKNSKCKYAKKLDNTHEFKHMPAVNPLFPNIVTHICNKKGLHLNTVNIKTTSFEHPFAYCDVNDEENNDAEFEVSCDKDNCLHYVDGFCTRHEILIGKRKLVDKWECKCFSYKGMQGHIDFSRFPQGGHVDDDVAEAIHKDNTVARSYSTHIRQKKETAPLKWKMDKKNAKKQKFTPKWNETSII